MGNLESETKFRLKKWNFIKFLPSRTVSIKFLANYVTLLYQNDELKSKAGLNESFLNLLTDTTILEHDVSVCQKL